MQAGLLLGSERIQVAAHIVEATQDMIRFTALGPLEDGMLDEMRQPVLLLPFITGAGSHDEHQMGDLSFLLPMQQSDAVG